MKRNATAVIVLIIIATCVALPNAIRALSNRSRIAVTDSWVTRVSVSNDRSRLICGSMGPDLIIVTLATREVQKLQCEPNTLAGVVEVKETGVVWACSRSGRLFSWNPGTSNAILE